MGNTARMDALAPGRVVAREAERGSYGGAEYGLEPPVNLGGVPLHVVKTCNATHAHYGEIAGGQPWVLSSS